MPWESFRRISGFGKFWLSRERSRRTNSIRPGRKSSILSIRLASPAQLFDAGYKSLDELMLAATGKANHSQDEIVDLLAGPPQKSPQGERIRTEVADRMRLGHGRPAPDLSRYALGAERWAECHGARSSARASGCSPWRANCANSRCPVPSSPKARKTSGHPGIISARHAELQVHTDLTKVIQQPGTPAKLEAARGQLAPFLRDTLVGLNYAYYEPPGSQILHINPLFVRSHDFSGETIIGEEQVWQAAQRYSA